MQAMAAPDPRRSSRARIGQSHSQLSVSSSNSSGRADRSTKPFNKSGSPQKSTPTASLSSEPPEDLVVASEDPLATRRRTRGQADERSRLAPKSEDVDMMSAGDEIHEEDEAVRCICGFDEYPGPPPVDDEAKSGAKDSIDNDTAFAGDVSDDMAGFFVQCDICKVWQHGACVGIMTEESSPDEYFCEQCRKDLHKIFIAKNGQRYSHYLPLKRNSAHTSRAGSLVKDAARSPRERDSRHGRSTSSMQISKRRSTMNSRDAGYDEAEALRRAIEASREEALHDPDGLIRRPKRVRSDSEEKDNAKRQRTSSRSISPSAERTFDDSEDAAMITRNGSSKSKSRNSAIRNQRAEKLAEREERERQRAEAASKRKGRAERRRADDSDPSEEMPLAVRAAASRSAALHALPSAEDPQSSRPASAQDSPDTPPANSGLSMKPSSRSHKKRGRNQYTKDREGLDEESPARSMSRDIAKDDLLGKMGSSDTSRSASKAKGGLNSKMTMGDLKRRATAILEFIGRTQLELAGETTPGVAEQSPRSSVEEVAKDVDHVSATVPEASSSSEEERHPTDGPAVLVVPVELAEIDLRDFKELNCLEMMDSLTRQLVKWQQEYGP